MNLFHIHDLDFGIDDIANDLTSRLERPHFGQVIEADLVSPSKGSLAHAQELDAARVVDGEPAYAYRLARVPIVTRISQLSVVRGARQCLLAHNRQPAQLLL